MDSIYVDTNQVITLDDWQSDRFTGMDKVSVTYLIDFNRPVETPSSILSQLGKDLERILKSSK